VSTSFEIQCSTGSYLVLMGSGLFDDILNKHKRDVVIADEFFAPRLASCGVQAVTIHARETSKSLDAIPEIVVELRKCGANRQTHLVALGGGVVQDVAGFIASIYMRGISWTYVPTTLLAMADSCIGGKSSINVGKYKNLVGTFHPPASVIIDSRLAHSLSPEQKVSGLIEACKISYCRGEDTFRKYLAQRPASSIQADQTEQIILLSLLAKKWFIETDEFDRKERLLLNFGHTFGHAMEGASDFGIAHGVGVGAGMLCALELGRLMGRVYMNAPVVNLLEDHVRTLLSEVAAFPGELAALSIQNVMERFQADKKHSSDHYRVILVTEAGNVQLTNLARNSDTLKLIEAAVTNVVGQMAGKWTGSAA
jgi:3-dehydroquinate synthase